MCRQIQAISQIEDCSYDERLLDSFRLTPSDLLGEMQSAERISFPEIDTFAKPVIIVTAEAKTLVL